ncbi:MAG TPA: protein kinase [Thermoanaerobaculia bacterium]
MTDPTDPTDPGNPGNPAGGRMVGRYRILDFLGAGAMGEVFLAEDPQIERRLAIKTVRLVGRPQEIEDRKRRLLREARAAGRLLHPNVVTLFDAGEAEGMLYLAFELVEGTDLAGRLESGPPISLREVLRIIRQVADALDFAHRQGIVHRDIKPSNILLDKQGKVKVADFGIAKVTGQSTELTVAGSVMGSPQYLSPEQIRGEELDGRSDIFSLGVVLYELLSQKRPFDGDTITTLVYQILHKEPPPISELRAVPERLEALLRRMLAKSRDDRFATAAELATEVAACERDLSDETLSAPASNLPMQATRILPKRTTDAVQTPVASAPPGTPVAGTSVPPPSLPPRVPTPPPIPARATAPPPVMPETAAPVVTTSRPGYGKSLAVAIMLVLFLMIGAGAAGVWWFFFRHPTTQEGNGVGIPPGQETPIAPSSTPPQGAADSTPPAVPADTTPPAVSETSATSTAQVPPISTPPGQTIRQTPPGRPEPPAQTSPPVPTPSPRQHGPFVPPVASSPERPQPPAPEPPVKQTEPDEEEQPRRPASGPVDQTLKTGLALVFRPTPPDAYVLVDGTLIGQATEWNGQKGGRTFTLSAGEHLIKLRSAGLKDFILRVEAGEVAGVTPILSHLKPMGAAQSEASDLKVYRVREAIGFRVEPSGATILVDGQPAGQVKNFGGRFAQPGTWLKLPPGRHRIGLTASGMSRQDFIVEVFEGADKDRDHIEATLQPGG